MLDLENITKTFNPGTVNEKKALSGLNLHLEEGDFVTVVGSNGAGKSTMFNAVAGSFYVDEGSICLDGRNITFMQEYRRSRMIGRLFQDPLKGTAPHMTIEENLALAFGHGIGRQDETAGGALERRTAAGADVAHGNAGAAQAAAAG